MKGLFLALQASVIFKEPPACTGFPSSLGSLLSHQSQTAKLEDFPDVGRQSSLAPGLWGSVPRVQTLELARAPPPGRADGVWKCILAWPDILVDNRRGDLREDGGGEGAELFYQER